MTETDTELLAGGRAQAGWTVPLRSPGETGIDREGLGPWSSVAGLALRHGVNANLLRTWMRRYQQGREGTEDRGAMSALPAWG